MTATPTSAVSVQETNQEDNNHAQKKEAARAINPHPLSVATKAAKLGTGKTRSIKPTQAVSKPTKFLPNERIAFPRQLDILRGWAAASGPLRKAVTNNDVAKIVDMQPSTVSMANAFFSSIGMLNKTESGYVPADEVTAFLRAWDWNKETAAQKLAPVLTKSWFWDALGSKLEFGPRSEADCIQDLADASKAGPDYRPNLRVLLEYLAAVGLIQRDGALIKKGSANMSPATSSASPTAETAPAATKQDPQATLDVSKMAPSLFGTTEGQVQFNIAVKVNMGEFSTWQADRIAAFFSGIAQVLAAKAKVEQAE
jgi:hypothetical protein